jgi:linoleoyl-CoA desaturase
MQRTIHNGGTLNSQPPPVAAFDELKFGSSDGFLSELRRRVDRYFQIVGRSQLDAPRMYVKTAFIFAWFAASYLLLLFVVGTWWLALPLALSLGLSMAAMGFNVQHDGGHRAYSKHKWINKLMAMSLDLLGGSSYVWAKKHNSIHHSYSNITGHDDDIEIGFFGRLSPHQTRWKFHRLQHFYLWVLYGFLPIKWQMYDDFQHVAVGRIGGHRLARPKGWDLATFVGGKVVFFALALAIPLLLHSVWAVLLIYLAVSFVNGVALSVVFQMAHCVEEAAFPMPRPETGRMEAAWAVHQVQTTPGSLADSISRSNIICSLKSVMSTTRRSRAWWKKPAANLGCAMYPTGPSWRAWHRIFAGSGAWEWPTQRSVLFDLLPM